MRTSSIRGACLALTATAALGAAAMTGAAATSQSAKASATRSVTAPAGEKLRFSATRLKAPAGSVTLKMTNRDDIGHNIAVRGKKLAKPRLGKIVQTGKVSKVTVNLPAGTYTFYCSVFGHESSGMRGTLTVAR
ncbi:MAG: cupredoxin domain-containing protein [Thermoleophilia bacterium]|nr:cupredoxin domain-containing protein [Thermoleophilia bacterium]